MSSLLPAGKENVCTDESHNVISQCDSAARKSLAEGEAKWRAKDAALRDLVSHWKSQVEDLRRVNAVYSSMTGLALAAADGGSFVGTATAPDGATVQFKLNPSVLADGALTGAGAGAAAGTPSVSPALPPSSATELEFVPVSDSEGRLPEVMREPIAFDVNTQGMRFTSMLLQRLIAEHDDEEEDEDDEVEEDAV